VFQRAIFAMPKRKLYALALLFSCPLIGVGADVSADRPDAKVGAKHALRSPQPTYEVMAGIDGDVFPVFANYASMQLPREREWGTVTVTMHNPTEQPIRQRMSVRIAGWSDFEIQMAEVPAGMTRTYKFAPTFLPRLYRNREITAATTVVEVSDGTGKIVFDTTVPVRLRSADDMYWGTRFKYAPFIAAWVTPHELHVEKILSQAKNYTPGRRLPGYEQWKDEAQQEQSTHAQARAIYDALKKQGLSYVKSSVTFGASTAVSQRVRMPRESIGNNSANCIDGTVIFASLFENLGMDPIVVLVPGHAYVGVRVARGSQRFLFIDSALVGRMTFDAAVQAAENGLAKLNPAQITRIPIDQSRSAGIYPMP
jgi:hypothetical protein